MALYISHSIFHLARLLYVRSETFGPEYVPVFTGLEGIISGDKDHNFISRSCVTFFALALFYITDTMTLTYIS